MAITGGFGVTMDLKRGTTRRWVMGRDGVKRWADSGEPVQGTAAIAERPSFIQLAIAFGKYIDGYRPGEDGWSPEDDNAYRYVLTASSFSDETVAPEER